MSLTPNHQVENGEADSNENRMLLLIIVNNYGTVYLAVEARSPAYIIMLQRQVFDKNNPVA